MTDGDDDSDRDAFESSLRESITEQFDADDDLVDAAVRKAGAFREDWDEDLTAGDVLDLLGDAPYDEFAHQFDYAVGELAADAENCTDSREYRLDGFGDLAADPEQGA